MVAIVAKHFDSLEFVKKSKELGATEELAEYQARKIEQAIDIAINAVKEELKHDELATKQDILKVEHSLRELELSTKQELKGLELKIAETKTQIIIWIGGLIIASSLLQHFFKWSTYERTKLI